MKGPILYQIVEGPHDPSKISMSPEDWEMDFNTGTLDARVRAILTPWLIGRDRARALDLVIYYMQEDTPPGLFVRLPVTALPLPQLGQFSHGLN